MTLTKHEKEILRFLLERNPGTVGVDVNRLIVASRSDNSYAETIEFLHDEDETDIASLSRIGGEYYLIHPVRDEVVDVMIELANSKPISVEIVPLGLDELPKDLDEFRLTKPD